MSPSGLRRKAPVLLLFLVLIVAILPVRLPNAQARIIQATGQTLSVSPTTVAPGFPITISGTGFIPGNITVTVQVAPSITVTSVANGSGIFPPPGGSLSVQIPTTQAAAVYTVSATDGTNTATTTFTVASGSSGTATLTFSPNPVASGSQLTFVGAGFTPFAAITVTQVTGCNCSTPANAIFATASGTFSYTSPGVAPAPGNYTFTATDSTGRTASNVLSVVPANTAGTSITLSPPALTPGASTTVTGAGFTPSGSVTISGPLGVITSQTFAANTSGGFSATVTPSSTAAAGTYTITASDGVHLATASFTFGTTAGTTLVASPQPVVAGSAVTLTGSGFSGTGAVTISGVGFSSTVGFTAQSVTQATAGTFSVAVTVAATTPAGTYTLTASDATKLATISLVITGSSTAGVTLVATPSNATAGQPVGLVGSGFTAGATVTITGAGATTTTTAAANGTIVASLTPPAATTAGSYTITASDGSGHVGSATIKIGATGISLVPGVASGTVGQVITFTGTGYGAGEQVTVSLASTSAPNSALSNTTQQYTATAAGTISGSYTIPALAAGAYFLLSLGQTSRVEALASLTIVGATATTTGTPGVVPFPTLPVIPTATPVALPQVSLGATTRIFAEGYTGTAAVNGKVTFNEKLYLFNPGTTSSTVTTTYYVYAPGATTGTTVTAKDTVAPGSTIIRSVNNDVGNDKFVSIVVQSTNGIVAETVITRVRADSTVLDSDSSLGSSSLSLTWNLAEGYTGASLQEYITLFNPGTTAATAQVQYLPSDTPAPAAQTVHVPANGRVTINVRAVYNGLVVHGSRNVAIIVTSGQAIVVDRSMYWGDGDGSAKYGYSLGPAIAVGKTTQSFAFLPAANGSQSFVTVLNPSSSTATATLTLRSLGSTVIRAITAQIGPNRRYTFVLPLYLTSANGAVTATLSAALPLVAEAGIYFGGSPNIGRHPGFIEQGTTGSNIGVQAEVSPGGAQLRLYNPGSTAIRVQVTLGTGGGPTVAYDQSLPSGLARTIAIPAGTDPRGILVVASGTVEVVLINGGDGFSTAWGGSLN